MLEIRAVGRKEENSDVGLGQSGKGLKIIRKLHSKPCHSQNLCFLYLMYFPCTSSKQSHIPRRDESNAEAEFRCDRGVRSGCDGQAG